MGRLTKNFEDGNGNVKCFASCRSCNGCICTDVYTMIDKLAHYEDLEEQGRLIELPCAVGDTVWTYWIDDGRSAVERYKPANEPLCILVKDLWGIKFFATKEEAEEKRIAKLKELEG